MKTKINKAIFIPGLSERAKDYRSFSKYMTVHDIDWNFAKLPKGEYNIVAGFSLGAILACEYALKHSVKTLILCSPTPGIETLEKIKSKNVIFLVGETEEWCLKEIHRVVKTLKCKSEIIVVPKAGHRIMGEYKRKLLDILEKI